MNVTRMAAGALCLIGIVGVIAIGLSRTPTQGADPARVPAAVVKVGVILATTKNADFIGKPERAILETLERQWAAAPVSESRQIVLQFADSGTNPAQALTQFRQFSADRDVLAIIGPSTSPESIPIAKDTSDASSDRTPPVVLSLAASREIVVDLDNKVDGGPSTRRWVFKFAQNDNLAANRLASEMIRKRTLRIAFLYQNDAFGQSGAVVFRDAVRTQGVMSIVYDVAFDAGLTRPEPIVAATPSDVDGILIWGTKPGPEQLVREFRKKGFQGQIYLSHGTADAEVIRSMGPASEGIIVVGSKVLTLPEFLTDKSPRDNLVRQFRDLWKKEQLPGEPSHFAGHARDAFDLLHEVFTKNPNIKTRAELRTAIERYGLFPGVTGAFNFTSSDHAGLTEEAFETYVVRNGVLVPSQPASDQ